MGGGILPFTIYKGNVLFLFGRENKDKYKTEISKRKLWSDFGGSREGNETEKETAIREGFEESSGFFGSENEVSQSINRKCVQKIEHNKYTTFVFYIPYDETLVKRFRKDFLYVKKHKPEIYNKEGLYEKDMIKWVPYNKLQEFKHESRVFYRGIVNKLIRRF
jgi:hypothetical protein